VPRKQRKPPTPEQVASLNRELERAWDTKSEPLPELEPAPVRVRTETDIRVDRWLKDFLGQ